MNLNKITLLSVMLFLCMVSVYSYSVPMNVTTFANSTSCTSTVTTLGQTFSSSCFTTGNSIVSLAIPNLSVTKFVNVTTVIYNNQTFKINKTSIIYKNQTFIVNNSFTCQAFNYSKVQLTCPSFNYSNIAREDLLGALILDRCVPLKNVSQNYTGLQSWLVSNFTKLFENRFNQTREEYTRIILREQALTDANNIKALFQSNATICSSKLQDSEEKSHLFLWLTLSLIIILVLELFKDDIKIFVRKWL